MASVHTDTPRARGDGDAPHVSPVTPDEDVRTILINRVSWGAVFAGVVIALVVQLVLNLLGIGLGAASFDPATSDNPSATTFSIGAGIWWAVSGILAALAGGYAAGRLAGEPKELSGAWHGLTAWALTTLLVFYLLTTTIGSVVGGAFRTIGSLAAGTAQTLGTTAQTAVQAAAPCPVAHSRPILQQSSARSVTLAAATTQLPCAMRRSRLFGPWSRLSLSNSKMRVSVLRKPSPKHKMFPVEEARSQVARYEQQYRDAMAQAKQQATAAAETAAKTVSRGALFGAIALVLGALAGWFGGRMGAVEPAITSGLLRGTRQLH